MITRYFSVLLLAQRSRLTILSLDIPFDWKEEEIVTRWQGKKKKKEKEMCEKCCSLLETYLATRCYISREENVKKYSSIIDYFTNYYQFLSRWGEKARVRIIINIISSLAFDAIQYTVNKLLYHVYSVLKRIKTDNEST